MPWNVEQLAKSLGLDLDADGVREAVEAMVAEHNDAEAGISKLKAKNRDLEKKAKSRISPEKIAKAAAGAADEDDLEELGDVGKLFKDFQKEKTARAKMDAELAELRGLVQKGKQEEHQRAVDAFLASGVNKVIPYEDLRPFALERLRTRVKVGDSGEFFLTDRHGEPLTNPNGRPWTPEQAAADLKTGNALGVEPLPSAFRVDGPKESARGSAEPQLNGGSASYTFDKGKAVAEYSQEYVHR